MVQNSFLIKKSKMTVILSFIIGILFLFLCACNSKVNEENYNKIQTGMTYNEVINILGDDYEVGSDANVGGYTSSCYIWENGGYTITVIFLNGKVYSKAQAK